jgi:polyhydroxyalkanoate synthesis regulator phasin
MADKQQLTDEQVEDANKMFRVEKHIQTILVALTTAVLLWVGNSVSQSRTEIAVLHEQVRSLQTLVEKIENRVADRYKAGDALKDLQLRDNRIDSLEKRLNFLEKEYHESRNK